MIDFWSLSNIDRRDRVSKLSKEAMSDIERWADPLDADGALDHSRSIFTAKFVNPNSSVLDVGCGAMALQNYLPDGCSYTPCDLLDRGNGCIVADLNKGEFPTGSYDYIIFQGVLEYVYDVPAILKKTRQVAANLLLDYTSVHVDEVIKRRNCGWVSDLSPGDLVRELIAARWKNIALRKQIDDRYLYICNT